MILYYLFDSATGEFSGHYEAQDSPLEEGQYIAPVHSTPQPPPSVAVGEAALWVDGAWVIKPDHRGETWFDAAGNAVEITTVGIPTALTSSMPLTVALVKAKASATIDIERSRDTACYANVTALNRTWQADKTSRDLLAETITLAQAGLPLPPVWRDANNSNMPVTSIADLLAIAGAMAVQTQNAYAKSWALKAQIQAATTVADVEAVTW